MYWLTKTDYNLLMKMPEQSQEMTVDILSFDVFEFLFCHFLEIFLWVRLFCYYTFCVYFDSFFVCCIVTLQLYVRERLSTHKHAWPRNFVCMSLPKVWSMLSSGCHWFMFVLSDIFFPYNYIVKRYIVSFFIMFMLSVADYHVFFFLLLDWHVVAYICSISVLRDCYHTISPYLLYIQ